MRILRLFLIHLQEAFTDRSRMVVWFLINLLPPLMMLLFWKGATQGSTIPGWTYKELSTYYLFLILLGSLVVAHIENDIAYFDINKGKLSTFLLKPFPYIGFKFFIETVYRLVEGSFGLLIFFLILFFFPNLVVLSSSPELIALSILSAFLGYIICFLFKMILGITALWFIDNMSLFEVAEVTLIVLAGGVMPIMLYPEPLRFIAEVLPFSYINYFPILGFMGKLTTENFLLILIKQIIWIAVLFLLYECVWMIGRKKFTGVGQ